MLSLFLDFGTVGKTSCLYLSRTVNDLCYYLLRRTLCYGYLPYVSLAALLTCLFLKASA